MVDYGITTMKTFRESNRGKFFLPSIVRFDRCRKRLSFTEYLFASKMASMKIKYYLHFENAKQARR
tara:strand:+ start:4660 stop:4857 length:198 start_codon:yes stop_codon:yes gene_type:complete